MSLKERLLQDLKAAMRDKNFIRKNTVQMVRSAVLQIEKDNKVTLDDDGVIEVIAKEVKKRRDCLPDYEKSGRQDLIDALKKEIEILQEYLPQQLTEEELKEIVRQSIQETVARSEKDMGKVMQAVMPKVKGRADGREASRIVKMLLG